MVDLGIGGYRSSIAGFTDKLLNIEIKSQRGAIADHYIYMHSIRSEKDYLDAGAQGIIQRDFDDKVANFVAELLVAGKDPVEAKLFLDQLRVSGFVTEENGRYVFHPFGAGVS